VSELGDIGDFALLDVGMASELGDARLALHWAAQLPSAAGTTLAQAASDFSHTSLSWNDEARSLAGVPLPDGRCVALRPADLGLVVFDGQGEVSAERGLSGATSSDALAWLGDVLGAELSLPQHDLPAHAVADGGVFPAVDPAHLEELARWFSNAAHFLDAVAKGDERAAPVRCWPHHFDIATLITLDVGKDAEEARSIGVGMTPGDGGVAMPYVYVTPWPYPATDALPALEGGGRWNTEGWVGALLVADALVAADAEAQKAQVAAFVSSALAASHSLL